jgi:hypothetical protein
LNKWILKKKINELHKKGKTKHQPSDQLHPYHQPPKEWKEPMNNDEVDHVDHVVEKVET